MYKISENQPDEKRQQYIDDAHRTINRALDLKQDDPNVHKWTAVILSAKKRHQTPTEAIKNMTLEKMHLMVSNVTKERRAYSAGTGFCSGRLN